MPTVVDLSLESGRVGEWESGLLDPLLGGGCRMALVAWALSFYRPVPGHSALG